MITPQFDWSNSVCFFASNFANSLPQESVKAGLSDDDVAHGFRTMPRLLFSDCSSGDSHFDPVLTLAAPAQARGCCVVECLHLGEKYQALGKTSRVRTPRCMNNDIPQHNLYKYVNGSIPL
jgi:hypothetical protein